MEAWIPLGKTANQAKNKMKRACTRAEDAQRRTDSSALHCTRTLYKATTFLGSKMIALKNKQKQKQKSQAWWHRTAIPAEWEAKACLATELPLKQRKHSPRGICRNPRTGQAAVVHAFSPKHSVGRSRRISVKDTQWDPGLRNKQTNKSHEFAVLHSCPQQMGKIGGKKNVI